MKRKKCARAPICAKEYQAKISGPLLDRIDICVEVPQIDIFAESKRKDLKNEDSKTVKQRVINARKIQAKRYINTTNTALTNANASPDLVKEFVNISPENEEVIQKAVNFYGLSMRAYNKILKVARTIADLENCEEVQKDHLLEALRYRKSISII